MAVCARARSQRINTKARSLSIVNNFADKVSFIWSVADLLRGPYKPAQHKEVMLPLTVLRRLDCVLAPTKERHWRRLPN
jgi:type I restriction enzyme M protein